MTADSREAGEGRKALRICLGRPDRRDVTDSFLDGSLEVCSARGVRGPDRVLLENLGVLTPGRILVVGSREGVVALATAQALPEAEVHWLALDAHEYHRTAATFRENPAGNLEMHLAADVPADGGFDRVVLPVSTRGDARLTGELMRQTFDALRDRGLLLAATDDSKDKWLHARVLDVFGAATIHAKGRSGAAYVARKKPGRKLRKRDFHRTFSATVLGSEIELETRPGVFSHGRLDEGTLSLSEVAEPAESVRLLDLGCGSGALGIAVARAIPGARCVLVDSSPRAVQLARKNALRNGVGDRTVVLLGYDLSAVREGAIDLVLANPPYFGDFRIVEMFSREAWRVLTAGGELLLVTKAPERPAEIIQEVFGNHEAIPRRGYTVIRGRRQE